jgi:hypothetical protein
MSSLLGSHQLPKAPDSAVNIIARAHGAPLIPEVDSPASIRAEQTVSPSSAVLPQRPAPVYLTVPIQPQPIQPQAMKAVMLTEEEFEAGPFALWRMEASTLLLLAMFCGGFYFVVSVLPTIDVLGLTGGLWAALAYMIKTSAAVTVGICSIWATGKIFEKHTGGIGDITVRTLTLHTMIDLAMLATATFLGQWIGAAAVVPVAALLARSMFRLSIAELGFVLLVNVLARLLLVGLILASAMSAVS